MLSSHLRRNFLTAFMTVVALCLVVITTAAHAQYQPHVIWDRSGETDSSVYGYRILPLGDQNDDGYTDWAVFAKGNTATYYGTRPALLEFFHGGNPPASEPFMVYTEDTSLYRGSWSALGVGDLNGDGFQDWAVVRWSNAAPHVRSEPIFFGGPDADTIPDAFFAQSGAIWFGDFNGDGYSDLYGYDFDTNVLKIYYGGSPLDTLPDWTLYHPPAGQIQSVPVAAGDFNGDGATDFLCFNGNSFQVDVFMGGAHPDTIPAYQWTGVPSWPRGGFRSINGDPYDEYILSDYNTTSDFCVWLGGPTLSTTPDFCANFPCMGAPEMAVSAGDFNHDGYNDLILLDHYCENDWFGSLSLYLGHRWLNLQPAFTIEGYTDPLYLISLQTAAGLGDVNGDGVDDIAIGTWDDTAYLGWRGRCVIVAGDPDLVAGAEEPFIPHPSSLVLSAYPNPFNGECTISLNVPTGVGHVRLTTYNLLGQIVSRSEIAVTPGDAICPYSAGSLATGLYLLRVEAGDIHATTKLMLLR